MGVAAVSFLGVFILMLVFVLILVFVVIIVVLVMIIVMSSMTMAFVTVSVKRHAIDVLNLSSRESNVTPVTSLG